MGQGDPAKEIDAEPYRARNTLSAFVLPFHRNGCQRSIVRGAMTPDQRLAAWKVLRERVSAKLSERSLVDQRMFADTSARLLLHQHEGAAVGLRESTHEPRGRVGSDEDRVDTHLLVAVHIVDDPEDFLRIVDLSRR